MTTLAEMEANWHREEMARSAAILVAEARRGAELGAQHDLPPSQGREMRVSDALRRLMVASHA